MEQPPNLVKAKTSYRSFPFSSAIKSKPPGAKRISISILVMSLPVLYVSFLHVSLNTLFHDTTFWFLISNTIIIIIAADSGVFTPSVETNALHDEFVKRSKASSACVMTKPSVIVAGKESSHVSDRAQDPPVLVDGKDSSDDQGRTQEPLALADDTVSFDEPEHDHEPQDMVIGEENLDEERHAQESLALVDVNESLDDARHAQEPPAKEISDNWRHSRSRSLLTASSRVVEKEKPLRRSAAENQGVEVSEYSSMTDVELNRRVEEFIRRFKEIEFKVLVKE